MSGKEKYGFDLKLIRWGSENLQESREINLAERIFRVLNKYFISVHVNKEYLGFMHVHFMRYLDGMKNN